MTDIWVLGLGIETPGHVTREAEQAIAASAEVLFVDPGIATRDWLGSLCPIVTPLYAGSYAERRARVAGYRHMAASVIAAAMRHRPVAFAMQGHPAVGVTATGLIAKAGAALGLEVRVRPGISSLDTLFADLMLDPMAEGLQAYEATDLLLRRHPLAADVPLLVWQAGNVETCLHTARVSRPERFERLRAHLLRFYRETHPVIAYHGATNPLAPVGRERIALGDLCAAAGSLHPGITLYLPPVGRRAIVDADLLARLDDPAHLARITR